MHLWLVAACSAPAPPPVHHAYVWQRRWTAPVREAVGGQQAPFESLRVHALAVDAEGVHRWAVEAEALQAAVPVARVETSAVGSWGRLVAPVLGEIVATWRATGVTVPAVEIDHDCPTAHLGRYAEQLRDLRAALPHDVELWHTALPTWTTDPEALEEVRAVAAGSVLQVHAVDQPEQGLFDPARADAWTRAYAGVSDRPFLVSVPTYGASVRIAGTVRALWADPADVVALHAGLRATRPPGWRGTAWFRLPVGDDPATWTWPVLEAAVRGHASPARVGYRARLAEPGLYDLVAEVEGGVARPAHQRVDVEGPCSVVEGLRGYTARRLEDRWRLEGHGASQRGERTIGWARCARVPVVGVP